MTLEIGKVYFSNNLNFNIMKFFLSSLAALMLSFQTLQSQVTGLSNEKPNQESSDYCALLPSNHRTSTDIILVSEDVSVYNFYMLEQNQIKTTAWILLGSGVALMVGAAAWNSNDSTDGFGFSDNFDTQGVMFLIGGAATLASIPFFISANSNKNRAMARLSGEMVSFKNGTYRKSNGMALALSVKF